MARFGSASAARSPFGGFVALPAGAQFATPLLDAHHWPELRIVVAVVRGQEKGVSSRLAMQRAALTSPYYSSWLECAPLLYEQAFEALVKKDLEALGVAMQKSYLNMFATMTSSSPPLFYWEPESLALIKSCEQLRREAIGVFETMDAGPQVKCLTLVDQVPAVLKRFQEEHPNVTLYVTTVGGGPCEL